MKLTLKIWRQAGPDQPGQLVTYDMDDVNPDMSFLEMLDVLNLKLIEQGEDPVVFEHDCREGICGCCGFVINGYAHGPQKATTVCQLHMRHFRDGETLVIEPFRVAAFPILKDLMVDRTALDDIVQAGGFISARTGSAPDAHTVLVPKENADRAFDAAACIGCGACVAACPNGSAMLFTSAKVSHLAELPQGAPERTQRALRMVAAHDEQGFGACSNHGECEAACPKEISIDFISQLNREFLRASVKEERKP
ncbi:MAG: succinate dehydrogenase/fumarate reductase iron-sulfur subunit, partial [Candidatus Dadabacteria bacterium]